MSSSSSNGGRETIGRELRALEPPLLAGSSDVGIGFVVDDDDETPLDGQDACGAAMVLSSCPPRFKEEGATLDVPPIVAAVDEDCFTELVDDNVVVDDGSNAIFATVALVKLKLSSR